MPIRRDPDPKTIVGAARLEGREEGFREGREEGFREGISRSVLSLLETRGVQLAQQERERVMACSDSDTLKRWLARAVTAETATDVFVDE